MNNRQSKPGDLEATCFSLQAQSVLDAANKAYWLWDEMRPADAGTIAAAALHAVADQVVPEERKPSADSACHLMNWTKALDTYYQRKQTRAEILAIATELENHY